VEYPSEEEIRTMTNQEFVSLIQYQANKIDQTLNRSDRPASATVRTGEPWI
jgi:hypothetical protein